MTVRGAVLAAVSVSAFAGCEMVFDVLLGPDRSLSVDAGQVVGAGADAGEMDGGCHPCAPEEFVTGAGLPRELMLHGGYLYWRDDTAINRRHLHDGTEVQTLVTAPVSVQSMFILGNTLFWVASEVNQANGALGAITLGETPVARTLATGLDEPISVTASGSHVYWYAQRAEPYSLQRLELPDGGPTTLLAADGGDLRFSTQASLLADSAALYFTSRGDQAIHRIANPATNSDTTVFMNDDIAGVESAVLDPAQLTIVDGYIYWSNDSANPALMRAKLAGDGGVELVARSGLNSYVGHFSVQGDTVIWSQVEVDEPFAAVIMRTSLRSHESIVLVEGDRAGHLAVDGTTLYYSGPGVIMRMQL